MKFFFWLMWFIILAVELYLFKGLLNILFHKYNPINMSSVAAIILFLVIGAAMLSGGYYLQHIQKIKWASAVVGLPLMLIVLYFFAFLILPYLMGERMN